MSRIRHRLVRLERRQAGSSAFVWDVITGIANSDHLAGVDREIWEELTGARSGRDSPCPLDALVGRVALDSSSPVEE